MNEDLFGHVSCGRLDIEGPMVESIIAYKPRKSRVTAKGCRLIFDIEGVEDWVMVEKQYMWENVLLCEENEPEYPSPGTTMLCLIGTANDYNEVIHLALVLKSFADGDGYERIGLLVSGAAKFNGFSKAREISISIF